MSGHSKWHSIKFQKGIKDARRGQTFTKLGNNIAVAAKKGGGDPSANFSLRLAMDKARQANMPKDNIDRAIKRGTGELGGTTIEELVLEGFGPKKVGIIIEALTDNKNRTLSDIRNLFNKQGYQLASSGAISYQFKQMGVIRFLKPTLLEEELEEKIIESGANDYKIEDDQVEVLTQISDLAKVKESLESAGLTLESAKIEYVPQNTIELTAEEDEKLMRFLEVLDENDDVSEIYTNAK